MKVFISADMEGVTGIARAAMTEPGHADYPRARELMTEEVNAAVEGALAGGATQVWVRDAHGGADNLVLEKLHPTVQLIQGWCALALMMQGVDHSFDAAFLVGYHSRAMTATGTISHTMTTQVRRLWYNGVEVGEYGISAAHAGHFGVPVVFVSGDESVCSQARELLGNDVTTAAVKTAYLRECVRMWSVEEARGLIRQGAREAVLRAGQIAPYQPQPVEVTVEFQKPEQAMAAAMVPTVNQVDVVTVRAQAANGLEAANLVEVLLRVSA